MKHYIAASIILILASTITDPGLLAFLTGFFLTLVYGIDHE